MANFDSHTQRRLADMEGMFLDESAYERRLEEGDRVLYEVYEIERPQIEGELLHGLSVVHPGVIGEEYFMTKGHFHTEVETAEVYFCLQGEGLMVMETLDGESAVEPLLKDHVLYVPPGWAHRSVNTSMNEDLVTFFAYPGNAGHDYGTIETQGFRKLVLHRHGETQIIDNPRWLPPGARS